MLEIGNRLKFMYYSLKLTNKERCTHWNMQNHPSIMSKFNPKNYPNNCKKCNCHYMYNDIGYHKPSFALQIKPIDVIHMNIQITTLLLLIFTFWTPIVKRVHMSIITEMTPASQVKTKNWKKKIAIAPFLRF